MTDPTKVTAGLRAAVHEIDPLLPVANVSTMEALLASNVAQPRFVAALLSAFGSVAAVMALVGVYGLLSFSVTRRVRELGVRMALGCGRARVLGLVLRQSAIVVGLGLGVGVALAYGLSRLLETLLFGISPHDPATISVTAVAIGLAAIVASVPPALRAARLDPVVALRED
jgi:putative ABC transport system permease protein